MFDFIEFRGTESRLFLKHYEIICFSEEYDKDSKHKSVIADSNGFKYGVLDTVDEIKQKLLAYYDDLEHDYTLDPSNLPETL